MANGWGGYNEAFANLGNFAANLILQNAERKRKEEEERERQEMTKRLVGKLIEGGEEAQLARRTEYRPAIIEPQTPTKFGDIFKPKESLASLGKQAPFREVTTPVQTFEPYTPEQKVNLAMQLRNVPGGAQTLDDYLQLQKFYNPPQQQPKNITTQNDKYLIFESPQTGLPTQTKIKNPQWKPNVVELNPNAPIFDEQTGKYVAYRGYPDDEGDVEILGQRYKTVSKYEKAPKSISIDRTVRADTNTLYERKGYYNPAADPKDPNTAIIGKNKYTITDWQGMGKIDTSEEQKDGSGNPVTRISKDAKKLLSKYYSDMAQLQAKIDGGTADETEREGYKRLNSDYANFIDANMSQNAKDMHSDILKIKKTENVSVEPKTYWNIILDNWKSKNIDANDLEWLTQKFKSIYKFDPLSVYGYKITEEE